MMFKSVLFVAFLAIGASAQSSSNKDKGIPVESVDAKLDELTATKIALLDSKMYIANMQYQVVTQPIREARQKLISDWLLANPGYTWHEQDPNTPNDTARPEKIKVKELPVPTPPAPK